MKKKKAEEEAAKLAESQGVDASTPSAQEADLKTGDAEKGKKGLDGMNKLFGKKTDLWSCLYYRYGKYMETLLLNSLG